MLCTRMYFGEFRIREKKAQMWCCENTRMFFSTICMWVLYLRQIHKLTLISICPCMRWAWPSEPTSSIVSIQSSRTHAYQGAWDVNNMKQS
jgi:hypothetical protein